MKIPNRRKLTSDLTVCIRQCHISGSIIEYFYLRNFVKNILKYLDDRGWEIVERKD